MYLLFRSNSQNSLIIKAITRCNRKPVNDLTSSLVGMLIKAPEKLF